MGVETNVYRYGLGRTVPMELIEAKQESVRDVRALYTEWFSSARRSIFLGTGLSTGMLNEDLPKAAFMSAINRGVTCRVLLDKVEDAQLSQYPWLWGHPRVEIRRSATRVPHWLIVDEGTKIRLEKPHPRASAHRANLRIVDCEPAVANLMVLRFGMLWDAGSRVGECPSQPLRPMVAAAASSR
jgi:hypothetical protein